MSRRATIDQLDNVPLNSIAGLKEPAKAWYSDQILPFDITISMCNDLLERNRSQ
jgi:hypothetical protein